MKTYEVQVFYKNFNVTQHLTEEEFNKVKSGKVTVGDFEYPVESYTLIQEFDGLSPQMNKELHEGYDKAVLEEYNDALKKLSEALENLNQNFKDKLKDAKDAYAEIWHIVNKNNQLF